MAKGECNCGGVAFEISADLSDVFVCHCSICRRSSGSNGMAVVVIDNGQFRWLRGEDLITTWKKPGADWQKWFCRICGSPLPGINDESRMFVPAGLVSEGAESLRVMHHIWVDSKAVWDEIGDAGRQHNEAFCPHSLNENLEIRSSTPDDRGAIESLYPEAFPDEDLLPLVRDLLEEPAYALSLVGAIDSSPVGHVIFTRCGVSGSTGQAALLGPLVVAATWRGRGIGTAIVHAGLQRLKNGGVSQVFVLGDPAYYGRLGFRAEARVAPPYELPPEWTDAWQSQTLTDSVTPLSGKLLLPRAWLRPELWLP